MTEDQLKEFRRYLHAHPELSTEEHHTRDYLEAKLKQLGATNIVRAGHTGLLLHFKGEEPGSKIALRADMDALPIEETNDFAHRSTQPGVSHKCGHDGHTSILLGVAAALIENPPRKGEVLLIFQPAEENGKGARAILEDDAFNFAPDMVYALHNLPGYPLHQIVCRRGSFTAAAKSIIIRLKGRTSHAAEPEKGINPGMAISRILPLSEELSNSDTSREDFRLISMVYLQMGERSYGVSAGNGEVHLTLRSWRNEVMAELEGELLARVGQICKEEHLEWEHEWLEVFHANENDAEAFQTIQNAAGELSLDFKENEEAFKWGEDFGLLSSRFGGAMFGIGAGEDLPALHNPDYDYPDEITPTAVAMFRKILELSL